MSDYQQDIANILDHRSQAALQVSCMGTFDTVLDGQIISTKEWGRDKTVQLFQFLITARHRRALHKEQIITRLWEDADGASGDRDFKVALHGIHKAIEPNRKSRSESKFIIRQGLTYQLDLSQVWIDSEAFEKLIAIANAALTDEQSIAQRAFEEAIQLYQGVYLPNRMYEDWTSEERERLQLLALGAYVSLSELILESNPAECIRLCQEALLVDVSWEDAYRLQMQAYMIKGNRPQAIKTFQKCQAVLEEEFGIEPLPKTKGVIEGIMRA